MELLHLSQIFKSWFRQKVLLSFFFRDNVFWDNNKWAKLKTNPDSKKSECMLYYIQILSSKAICIFHLYHCFRMSFNCMSGLCSYPAQSSRMNSLLSTPISVFTAFVFYLTTVLLLKTDSCEGKMRVWKRSCVGFIL